MVKATNKNKTSTKKAKLVNRLLGFAKEWVSRDAKMGRKCGEWWATTTAEISELELIEGYFATGGRWTLAKCRDPRQELQAVIWHGQHWQNDVFWEFAEGFEYDEEKTEDRYHVNTESNAFVVGFAEGAMAVWATVKDEVNAAVKKSGNVVA